MRQPSRAPESSASTLRKVVGIGSTHHFSLQTSAFQDGLPQNLPISIHERPDDFPISSPDNRGRPPRPPAAQQGHPRPADPPTVDEIVAVMRHIGDDRHGWRLRIRLRHAHALELAREGVPLNIIQRQLVHANLGTTSIYLQGIDPEEIITAVRTRRAPMMSASAGLRL
jgi:Phage integrase family